MATYLRTQTVEMCAGRTPSIAQLPTLPWLILRRLFHLVDDHDVDRRLGRFQLQSQLLLESGEQIWSSIGIVGRGRWSAAKTHRLSRIECERHREEANWGAVMAAGVVALVPAGVLLVIAQRYIATGLTAGAVKG